jgi:hypothetical protein
MINPPFPYQVTILRKAVPSDPFEETKTEDEVIYSGECDFENNRYPIYRDGVQVGKYKVYIPDNMVPVDLGDIVELDVFGRQLNGEIVEFFPTNFGLTISWDNANN